jgi:KilA-N domain
MKLIAKSRLVKIPNPSNSRELKTNTIEIMSQPKKSVIEVQGTAIAVLSQNEQDYISLTDIARYRNTQEPFAIINNWMRSRSTIEFLGLWEKLSNPDFKPLEFERFKNEAGSNYFVLSPQRWIAATQAKGITSKSGRHGGTFAHRDIAFEFASWISSEFKLYLIKEFQRLKDDENRRLSLAWNLNRTLSKLNYRIHTDAVKAHLIPPEVTPAQAAITYATEADLLNVALFGQTARQWRDANPRLEGNVRDYSSVEQLLVLANMEGMNAEFIHMGLPQGERLKRLNQIAIRQIQVLTSANLKALPGAKEK